MLKIIEKLNKPFTTNDNAAIGFAIFNVVLYACFIAMVIIWWMLYSTNKISLSLSFLIPATIYGMMCTVSFINILNAYDKDNYKTADNFYKFINIISGMYIVQLILLLLYYFILLVVYILPKSICEIPEKVLKKRIEKEQEEAKFKAQLKNTLSSFKYYKRIDRIIK